MIKKIIWAGESAIDPTWQLPIIEDLNEYKQFILDHVDFAVVLKNLKLRPENCSTGKYTHRMRCPFKFHKNGRERTPSFRFHNKKNTFTCFGCGESSDILGFLQIYIGGSEQFHLQYLANMVGLIKNNELQLPETYITTEQQPEKKTNYNIFFDAGVILRDYLSDIKEQTNYLGECEWVDRMFIKIDKYFGLIDEENIDDANKILDKLKIAVEKRKK